MDTAQKAGIALVVLLLVKVLVYMWRFYRRGQHKVPQASVILIVGAHMSRKSEMMSYLQGKLCNSQRLFMNARFEEVAERLSPGILPTSAKTADNEIGDPLFDAWTFTAKPDRSIDLSFTERGTRAVIGLHRSWAELVKAGNNLIIDYTYHDSVLFMHLLTCLKSVVGRRLDRLIVIEIDESFSSIQESETSAPKNSFPAGFALSTFKNQKHLRQLTFGSAHRCLVKVTDKLDAASDTAYRFIRQTGLL